MEGFRKVLFVIFIIIVLLFGGVYIYFQNYYHANLKSNEYMKSTEEVSVSSIEGGYFFDGPGTENAVIFYSGARVEESSYARLMYKLAENGVDCFLMNMAFKFPIINKNAANKVINKYDYNNWCMMGHSLGGVVAAEFASEHSDKVKSVVLLASYPNKKINNDLKVLLIYGDKDGVINMKKYEKNKEFWNSNTKEQIINGGNHAQYGNYGLQSGDNHADISDDEQQDITVESIVEFINK